jgi:nucleosome assembly protein 1-like 1
MMQNKLSGLIGRSSGYVESLPPQVRRRVAGLKGVQKEHSKLEAEFQEEVLQLEKRFFAKFTPLYEKRSKIVNGEAEPTEEEVEAGEADEEEEDEEEKAVKAAEPSDASAADMKGIPEFWLSAMKNSSLAETITDRDEDALKHLTDIRMEYLDRPGFRLIFEFADNDFFTNKLLTKTYFYQEENGYGGDFIYDHAEGDKIDWKAGKDLTVKIESKKQRNKSALRRNHTSQSNNQTLTSSQIPSRLESSRRLSPLHHSSTSSTPPPHQMMRRRRLTRKSKPSSNSTINWVRTSRRS